MPTARRCLLALLTTTALLVGACSSDDETGSGQDTEPAAEQRDGSPDGNDDERAGEGGDDVVYPGEQWERAEPEEMGLDAEVLDEVAAAAEQGDSNCLLVTRKGRIVGEWYWNGTDAGSAQEVFSATKSFASTLIGIAQDRGELDITEPASNWIDEWADGPSADVTVEDLLSNDSGREWSLALDYGELIAAGDKTGFGIGLGQQHERDTVWAYNNAAIQTLDRVLSEASGRPGTEFAQEHLLDPIGMADSSMTTDEEGHALMFMGLRSTCEDMARFGHLFLRGGQWDGEQVVSREWVEAATQPSQELTSAYGYLWWLNIEGPLVDPTIATGGPQDTGEDSERGQMVEGAPEDMFWARGLGGQIVAVDPGSETVVVRLGPGRTDPGGESFGASDMAEIVTRGLLED